MSIRLVWTGVPWALPVVTLPRSRVPSLPSGLRADLVDLVDLRAPVDRVERAVGVVIGVIDAGVVGILLANEQLIVADQSPVVPSAGVVERRGR